MPSLVEHLRSVPDFRRAQGRRFSADQMLMMIILGIMSGRYGYRELASFARANADALREHLGIRRDQLPSHVSFSTFINNIDFEAVRRAFIEWASGELDIAPGDLLSVDAKALGSTVSNYSSAEQDFVAIVSVYCQRQGAVLSLQRYHNGRGNELATAVELIEQLNITGAVISADALHCKKKRLRRSSPPATTT